MKTLHNFQNYQKHKQESLDELFGFVESYQIFNSFNNNPKQFIKTLDDMKNKRRRDYLKIYINNQKVLVLTKVKNNL